MVLGFGLGLDFPLRDGGLVWFLDLGIDLGLGFPQRVWCLGLIFLQFGFRIMVSSEG